jgi:hypothetical protein
MVSQIPFVSYQPWFSFPLHPFGEARFPSLVLRNPLGIWSESHVQYEHWSWEKKYLKANTFLKNAVTMTYILCTNTRDLSASISNHNWRILWKMIIPSVQIWEEQQIWQLM